MTSNRKKKKQEKKAFLKLPKAVENSISITESAMPQKSNRLKTLIVFDTNSLRSTEAGEVAYSFFAFGRPFQVIEEFIIEKNLADDIHMAIPKWAIEELKDQKQRQYQTDIAEFQKLVRRLSGLPHIPEISLPEEEFNCSTYVEDKALAYLATKQVKLLEIKEELANTVLHSMMKRVMKDQSKKQPFAHSGKYKDAGFKDNIVWESLMHFEGIVDFNKVIFITKDTDYTNCQDEFKKKWNRHITITSDENNAITEIKKDYGNYIEERAIHDFADKEYFMDYLFDQLKVKTEISINDSNFKIENFAIENPCTLVERMPPNDEEDEYIIIHSQIIIHFTEAGEKKQQVVMAQTKLADEESKEIIETTYDIELI